MVESSVETKTVVDSLMAAYSRLDLQWKANGWQPTMTGHTLNWTAPPISLDDLRIEFEFTAHRIGQAIARGLNIREISYLLRYKERCEAFQPTNLSSDPGAIIRSALELLDSIARNIAFVTPPPEIDWSDIKKNKTLVPKDLIRRLRYVEARLLDLEPRAEVVAQKVADIEAAHEAAEQLPTDLAELRSQRIAIEEVGIDIDNIYDGIKISLSRADDIVSRLTESEQEYTDTLNERNAAAIAMIRKSEQALRGSTSVGLAKAFISRKRSLSVAGIVWTLGLAAALGVGLVIGAERLGSLRDVLSGQKPASVVWANVILTIFSIGGPIWFAWLATKQAGASFRLAEDYAFKASVSQAYEGYRTEAASIDPNLQARLFASALTRIEEPPIRLLDKESHSSPLAELLNNPALRANLESIPGIKDKILALIPSAGGTAAILAPAAATAAALTATAGSDAKKPIASDDNEVI